MLGNINVLTIATATTPLKTSSGGNYTTVQQFIDGITKAIHDDPQSALVRSGLTLAMLVVALVASRWLAGVVERVPVRVETRLGRSGKTNKSSIIMARVGLSQWLGRLTAVCVWVAAAVALGFIWFAGAPRGSDVSNAAANFGKLLGESVIVIAVTLGAASVLQRTVAASLSHNNVNKNLTLLGGRLIYMTALVIGFIVVLSIWGTGIVLPVALLGALTVALSLALQGVLTNLVSGIYLLLEHPFVIGDQITLSTFTGDVEDIQIRYTALRTEDGQRVIIPNSMLFNLPVVNHSHYHKRRGGLNVALADTAPETIDQAEERLDAALSAVPGVLRDPAPQIILNGVTGGRVELQVIFWMMRGEFSQEAATFSQLIEAVRGQLSDAEVSVLDQAASTVAS